MMQTFIRKILFVVVLFYSLGSFSFAQTLDYNGKQYKNGDRIKITGTIASIGSAPLVRFVIIDDQNIRFAIPSAYKKKILKHIKKSSRLTINGKLQIKTLTTVDNKKSLNISIKPVWVKAGKQKKTKR